MVRLQMARTTTNSSWTNSIYGSPPRPFRPDHPKQVAGTYYRGNCERNAELFNNGNYLTAIFRVSLCNSEHAQISVGDPLPTDGILLRLEIERRPGTTDFLYSEDLMASVFLSSHFYDDRPTMLADQPAQLESLEEGRRWVAFVPLGTPDAMGNLQGLIYVYTGHVDKVTNSARGTIYYGISYDLKFADGKLTADSDLWMNSFGNSVFADPVPPGKLPYKEWFYYRPMPVITGENSKDPKLLGVEEYVKKGLIKPPPAGESQTTPEAESATDK